MTLAYILCATQHIFAAHGVSQTGKAALIELRFLHNYISHKNLQARHTSVTVKVIAAHLNR
jgi:hypothetical protein